MGAAVAAWVAHPPVLAVVSAARALPKMVSAVVADCVVALAVPVTLAVVPVYRHTMHLTTHYLPEESSVL
jgi:hypothetical protein